MKKTIIILSTISIILIITIAILLTNSGFKPPKFDNNAKKYNDVTIDTSKIINVNNAYAFYIEGSPHFDNDYLMINFYSFTDDNVYLKVRVLQNDDVIAESGLIKKGEYLEKIKIKDFDKKQKLTYLIMSYEKDTYYSLGEVLLNFIVEA